MTWVLLWYNNVNAVYDEISWVLVIKIAINILFKKGCMQNFGKRTVQNHYDYMWNVHRKHTKQRVCVCVCVCVSARPTQTDILLLWVRRAQKQDLISQLRYIL